MPFSFLLYVPLMLLVDGGERGGLEEKENEERD